jgi:hypothetical protein
MIQDQSIVNNVNVIIYIAPKETSSGMKSGLLGGCRVELSLSIHLPKNVALKISVTCTENSGGAPYF